MKIRQGFVSNSSSSSFVIVLNKNDFENFFNELNKLEQKAINIIKSDCKLNNNEMVSLKWFTGNMDFFPYENVKDFSGYNMKDLIEEKIDKNKYILIETDC